MTVLSVITVTHDSGHIISSFLSFLGPPPAGFDIIVVDSGSRDLAQIRNLTEDVGARFVDALTNVGYGAGSNRGALVSDADWFAFVNPDVEVNWKSLAELVGLAQAYGLACIGPQIVDGDGVPVPSGLSLIRPPWSRRLVARQVSGDVVLCEAVSGCALVIERRAFHSIAGFDESFFMFAEEYDLLKRLAEVGGKVGVARGVSVRTVGGASSSSVSLRWRSTERHVGHIRYIRKHHGLVAGVADLALRCAQVVLRGEFSPVMVSLRQIFGARPLGGGVRRVARGSDAGGSP